MTRAVRFIGTAGAGVRACLSTSASDLRCVERLQGEGLWGQEAAAGSHRAAGRSGPEGGCSQAPYMPSPPSILALIAPQNVLSDTAACFWQGRFWGAKEGKAVRRSVSFVAVCSAGLQA